MSVDEPGQNYHDGGRFIRPESIFRNVISKDPDSEFPAETGRYALYLSPSCPWAHRTLIVRLIKGLENIVDLYLLDCYMGPEGWFFSGNNGSLPKDPLHGFTKLKDLYRKADPNYVGRFTVPLLWDKKSDRPVNNESSEIIRMLYTEFDGFLPAHLREADWLGGGLYPQHLRDEIDGMNDWVYSTVNDGVYKVGFSKTQEAFEEANVTLFASLDRLEGILGHGKPYLLGDAITEADIRLYPTLIRFDVACFSVLKCNLKMVRRDYPRLHLWLRRLYWDQDEQGPLRAAFYRSTEPYMANYALNYAASRRRVMDGDEGPLIVPNGPAVLIAPLADDGS